MKEFKQQSVKEIIQDIQNTRTQIAANKTDELRVAMAMLNDPNFKVDVYDKNGVAGQYCPYTEARAMVTDILEDTTHMTEKEAMELADNYQFTRANAERILRFSKQYVLTYTECGRKLPLGCRATSNISLLAKHRVEKENTFPMPTNAHDEEGNKVYTEGVRTTPAYDTLRVLGSCPPHLKPKS